MTTPTKAAELAELIAWHEGQACHARYAANAGTAVKHEEPRKGMLLKQAEFHDKAAALLRASEGRAPVAELRWMDPKGSSWCVVVTDHQALAGLPHKSPLFLAAPHPPAQQAEPLFLLHTGEIDSSGEQAEWEIEHDSQQRVDAFCALNPGVTVKLFAGAPPHKAETTAGYLVETEKGPMYWPADQSGLEEARTYCDDDEEPVELIRRPHKAEGSEQ